MSNYILGLDPSLSSTGWAVINGDTGTIIECGKFTTSNKDCEDDRLYKIGTAINLILDKHTIRSAVMESQFLHKNVTVSMQLSRVRGVLVYILKCHGASIEHYSPSEIKLAITGHGNSDKEDVAKSIIECHGDNPVIQAIGTYSDKSNKSKTSDIYDAIAVGLTSLSLVR